MYTVTSVVPFEMVLDIDLGLWKYIQAQYPNPIFFRKSVLEERDMNFMKYMITMRDEVNPMALFLKPEYHLDADSLYNEFMDKHYDDILDLSVNTGIFSMMRRSKYVSDVMRFTILCKSDKEKSELLKRFKKYEIDFPIEIVSDFKKVSLSHYGSIYVKNLRDVLNYSKFEGKNIIMGNYKFNFESGITNVPLKEIALEYSRDNPIRIIDIHTINEYKLPIG